MKKIKLAIKDYKLFFSIFLLKDHKFLVFSALFLGFLSTFFSSLGLGLYIPVISSFFATGESTDFFTKISNGLFAFLGVSPSFVKLLFIATITMILGAVFTFFTFLVSGHIFVLTLKSVKDKLIARLLQNQYAFFTKEKVGKIVLVLTEQSSKAALSIENIFRLFVHTTLVLGFVAALIIISWKLTLTMAVFGLFGLAVSLYLGNRMQKISQRAVELNHSLSSFFTETIVGIKTIKSMGLENYRHKCAENLLKAKAKLSFKQYLCNYLSPFTTRIIAALFGFACIYAGVFWFGLKSEIIVFLVVTIRLNSSMYFMNQAWVNLAESLPKVSLVLEYFKSEDDRIVNIEEVVKTKKLPPISLDDSIQMKNVSFSYSKDTPILDDVNIEIKKNQFVALVGPSGGGKTTIVDLLLGLYLPDKGDVLYDGKHFSCYSHENMASKIGNVSQDVFLFNASIIENISYGDAVFDMERIKKSAALANATTFIDNLNAGYGTILGDRGVKLSGGQRQRIALARALYNQPKLLVLDEATSALDTESEQLIQKSLEEIYGQLTIIAIAHRLSTIKKADMIYYIDKGRVVEYGTHDELIKADASYKKLCELQFS